jgi:hypothetical protein
LAEAQHVVLPPNGIRPEVVFDRASCDRIKLHALVVEGVVEIP